MSLENEDKPIPSYSEFLNKGNAPIIEKREYTDEEYRKMAKELTKVDRNVLKTSKDVKIQALIELGVSEEILEVYGEEILYAIDNNYEDREGIMHGLLDYKDFKTISIPEMGEMGSVLRTLNDNLMIEDNYIAIMDQSVQRGNDGSSAQYMQEFFMDKDGLCHRNVVEQHNYTNIEEDKKEIFRNNNNYTELSRINEVAKVNDKGEREYVSVREAYKTLTKNREDFEKNGVEELTIEGARQILSIPEEEFDWAHTEDYNRQSEEEQKGDIIDLFSSKWKEKAEQKKEERQQKSSDVLAKLIEVYDSLDITPDYLGSIKGLIKDSLDKESEREQEEQK